MSQFLADSKYPQSKKAIQKMLVDSDIVVSDRTLERDLKELRELFGEIVIFDRSNPGRQGYRLQRNEDDEFGEFWEIFERLERLIKTDELAGMLLQYAKSPALSLDPKQLSTGIQHLPVMLDAAKAGEVLELRYQSFSSTSLKTYVFEPYVVAERANRWYVLGYESTKGETRTFGLDRIKTVKKLQQPRQSVDISFVNKLDSIFGITYSDAEIEDIVIACNELQYKYFQTLPLHKSQVLEKQKDGRFFMKLRLRPNFDLVQELMRFGDGIEVLEPQSLRLEIAERLISAATKYQNT